MFDEYCKEKARAVRQAKLASASDQLATPCGEIEKKDPEKEYRALLEKEVRSTRTRWEEFRKTWKKDRRFFAFGRDEREREKVFKAWLRELGESTFFVMFIFHHKNGVLVDSFLFFLCVSIVKRAAVKKAEEDFYTLLSESSDLEPSSVWKDVRPPLPYFA